MAVISGAKRPIRSIMLPGGLVERGIKAEGKSFEDVTTPLTSMTTVDAPAAESVPSPA
jgi:hypothetical protein